MQSGTEPPPMPGRSSTPSPMLLTGRRQLLNQSARIRIWLARPVGKIVLVVLVIVVIGGFFFVRSLPHTSRGNAWALQPDAGTSDDLSHVVWSGTQFVAVGDSGIDPGISSGVILTSPDGQNWTSQTANIPGLNGVTWSGTQFVAVGLFGTILTSADGRIWASQDSGTTGNLNGVAWSGTQFVAVGAGVDPISNNGAILTSPDGRTWASQNAATAGSLDGITWSGTQFVAVGNNYTDGVILTSPDGRTWTNQKTNAIDNLPLVGVTWSGSQFVAVGSQGAILTSP